MAFIKSSLEVTEACGNGLPSDYFPIFQYIKLPAEKKLEKIIHKHLNLYYSEFEKHRENFDPENVTDFFDTLILTQKEAIAAGEEDAKLLTDTHLVQTVVDLFGGKN